MNGGLMNGGVMNGGLMNSGRALVKRGCDRECCVLVGGKRCCRSCLVQYMTHVHESSKKVGSRMTDRMT